MWRTEIDTELVKKYNRPVPRYTSYPTVPFWNNSMSRDRWKDLFTARFDEQNHTNGISIYIHCLLRWFEQAVEDLLVRKM